MAWLRELWKGETPLPEAFWWCGIVYGFVVNAVMSGAALAVASLGWPIWLVLAVSALADPYNLLVLVGVLRSAARWRGAPHWAALARAAIVAWVVVATVL